MTNARDIMNDFERIGAQDTVEAATQKMADLHVDALPICGTDGNVMAMQGMITERDIAEQVVAEGRDPAHMLVGELPQTDTGTIGADDPVDGALDTMAKHHIDRLPVLDHFRVVGILDQADVENALPHDPS